MLAQSIKKILSIIPMLLIVSIILFSMMSMLPGNAALMILGDMGDTQQLARVESTLGLDQPIYVQYFHWLSGVLKGDFGRSFLTSQPVVKRILERMPVTVELILLSVAFATIVGVPVGILCASKRNSASDYAASVTAMIGVAMPAFWIGMLLIMLFSIKLKWLPASGYASFASNPVKNLRTMALPVFAAGISLAATIVRQTRSAMLDVLKQDYIVTAEAKGQRRSVLLFKHALKNAAIPVVTAISMQISSMIGGSVVIEQVFLLPGMGKSMVDAIFQRDYPIVMAQALLIASFVVLINTVVDILYIIIDPRISHAKSR